MTNNFQSPFDLFEAEYIIPVFDTLQNIEPTSPVQSNRDHGSYHNNHQAFLNQPVTPIQSYGDYYDDDFKQERITANGGGYNTISPILENSGKQYQRESPRLPQGSYQTEGNARTSLSRQNYPSTSVNPQSIKLRHGYPISDGRGFNYTGNSSSHQPIYQGNNPLQFPNSIADTAYHNHPGMNCHDHHSWQSNNTLSSYDGQSYTPQTYTPPQLSRGPLIPSYTDEGISPLKINQSYHLSVASSSSSYGTEFSSSSQSISPSTPGEKEPSEEYYPIKSTPSPPSSTSDKKKPRKVLPDTKIPQYGHTDNLNHIFSPVDPKMRI